MTVFNKTLRAIGAGTVMALFAPAALAQDSHNFAVVGTWGQLAHWQDREGSFWNEVLPAASDGRLTATARPLTELGMDGTTVMRELRSGAFDFAHGVFLYVAADSPVIEGGDLVGARLISRRSGRSWMPIARCLRTSSSGFSTRL
ncbi:MAG: hypothetical protein JJT95_15315 [Pararhodobacter sp.]|nr:hypothetical protein [Pararhodobacter sp.]